MSRSVASTSLRNAVLSHRVFASVVLLSLGLGYAMSLVYLYAREIKPHQDMGHGLVQGIAHNYHGIRSEPRLIASLRAGMRDFIVPDESRAISQWIATGGSEEVYATTVQPIIEEKCLSCHDQDGYPPILSDFSDVKLLIEVDTGMNVLALARVTHVHLLAIPLFFCILGALFIRTRFPEVVKSLVVVVPFVGIFADISGWWLTHYNPVGAWSVVLGGTLMSLGFGLMWIMTAYDIVTPVTHQPNLDR